MKKLTRESVNLTKSHRWLVTKRMPPQACCHSCLVPISETGTDEEILHCYTPSTTLNAFHVLISFILTMKLGLREFVHLLLCLTLAASWVAEQSWWLNIDCIWKSLGRVPGFMVEQPVGRWCHSLKRELDKGEVLAECLWHHCGQAEFEACGWHSQEDAQQMTAPSLKCCYRDWMS